MNNLSTCNSFEALNHLRVVAEATGKFEDERFSKLYVKLCRHHFDPFLFKKLFDQCLESRNFPSLLDSTFSRPATVTERELLRGDFPIGHVLGTDIEVGILKEALCLHTLISGATGFGKTSAAIALSDSIQKEGEIIEWKIDPKGMGDFRHQAKKYSNFVVIPLSKLRLNPFGSIHNVPRRAIMEASIEILSDSFNVYDASQGVIAEHVSKVFEREEHPCFHSVMESILAEKKSSKYSRRQSYLDTIEVRLRMTWMSLREIFECRVDYFDELHSVNTVFEVGGTSVFTQNVLVPFIIMKFALHKAYGQ